MGMLAWLAAEREGKGGGVSSFEFQLSLNAGEMERALS